MARRVIDHIAEIADQLRDQGAEAERLGRMPDNTAKLLKAAGPIKLLQPKQYGGFEAHPREFAKTVMAVAALDGATGWVCGVVDVHRMTFDRRMAGPVLTTALGIWQNYDDGHAIGVHPILQRPRPLPVRALQYA
jgi:hypothetical protein